MTTAPTFPIDPADMFALKNWLAAQVNAGSSLRSVDIDEILIGHDVLLELPAVLQGAGIQPGAQVLLVMDETPMRREREDLKPFVQALLHNAGYHVEPLWLKGDQYGLVHADFDQVDFVQASIEPGTALVTLGSGTVTDIAKHAAYLYHQENPGEDPVVYICCQTANSVTAYAANMAVLLKNGVQRPTSSRYPSATLSGHRVLSPAPQAITPARPRA